MRTAPLDLDLFQDDSSDDEFTDVSKRHGFMRIQARPPTVLAKSCFLNNTHEEGLDLPAQEAKPLPEPLRHRFTSRAKIARLKHSISLTADRLRKEELDLHGKKANRGLEILDKLILRDLCAKHGGASSRDYDAVASSGGREEKTMQRHPPTFSLSLPPNPTEVKLMRALGLLRRLKRQQALQHRTVSSSDAALEVDVRRVQSEIEALRQELHAAQSAPNKAAEETHKPVGKLPHLDSSASALKVDATPRETRTYEGTDLLRFAREDHWRGPLSSSSADVSSKLATPSTKQSKVLRGILRSASTADAGSRVGSSVGGSRKRITWSPIKAETRYSSGREIADFDKIPTTAEMGLRTLTRRTEFRKTMGRVTGKEAKKKLARRRLSNAAASARAIARIRLAAKRAQEREKKKSERVRRASLGFAGPAPRPDVLARFAAKKESVEDVHS
eukprot:g798.t1